MNCFYNVNFNFVKDKLTDGILNKINVVVSHYRNCFLNDPSYFNCVLSISTTLNFFNEENNIQETIEFKPLTIEDFLYRTLDELIFDFKICLKQSLNDMKEKNHLHFFKFDIVHMTNGNCELKDNYFKK